MLIELVETRDMLLDYSDVYKNKNSLIPKTTNYRKQDTILHITAYRFHTNNISLSLSNQASLFDLYTFIKVQCYKETYHIRKPTFTIRKMPIDFIPLQPKNPLSCIIHQLCVINKKDEILQIPNDSKITIETFMKSNPDFFTKSYGRYTIYILDECAVQRQIHKKTNNSVQNFMLDLKTVVQKYINCAHQR